jgi:hypothetical protein
VNLGELDECIRDQVDKRMALVQRKLEEGGGPSSPTGNISEKYFSSGKSFIRLIHKARNVRNVIRAAVQERRVFFTFLASRT